MTAGGLFIASAWQDCGGAGESPVHDPATGEVLRTVPAASADDTRAGIAAAEARFARWSALPAWSRADCLHKIADAMIARSEEAAQTITQEAGKPIAQARREWQLSIDQFRWYAEEARRIYGRIVKSRVPGGRIEVTHDPVGIVAAFTAWNLPAVAEAPFGGIKYSGMGREGGVEGIGDYSNVKLAQVVLS